MREHSNIWFAKDKLDHEKNGGFAEALYLVGVSNQLRLNREPEVLPGEKFIKIHCFWWV
jgi:hypothetical protein